MSEDLQAILSAARHDILQTLGMTVEETEVQGPQGYALPTLDIGDQPLLARDFARVLFIARRAELVASADGRLDWTQVLTKALDELEGKAPRMYVTIRNVLLGGNVLLQRKYEALEADHAKLREGTEKLTSAIKNVRERALTSGNENRKYLASGDRTPEVLEAEIEDDVAQELGEDFESSLPRDPKRTADRDIDDELTAGKEPPPRV